MLTAVIADAMALGLLACRGPCVCSWCQSQEINKASLVLYCPFSSFFPASPAAPRMVDMQD